MSNSFSNVIVALHVCNIVEASKRRLRQSTDVVAVKRENLQMRQTTKCILVDALELIEREYQCAQLCKVRESVGGQMSYGIIGQITV